jgi:hypothetical protein
VKKRNTRYQFALVLLCATAWAACNKRPAIQFESGSICVTSPDGKKDCQPVSGSNMVILQKDGKAVQLTAMQAPGASSPNFPGHTGEVAYLHEVLSAQDMVYDFDPQTTRMDWTSGDLRLMAIATGKELMRVPSSELGIALCYQVAGEKNYTLSILQKAVCERDSDITSLVTNERREAVVLCEMEELCADIPTNGPVIVVQVDNILDPDYVPGANWWREFILKKSRPGSLQADEKIAFRRFHDPNHGGDPVPFDQNRSRPIPLLANQIGARSTFVCVIAEQGLKVHICNHEAIFETEGAAQVKIETFLRKIVISRAAEGGYSIEVVGSIDSGIWVNPESRSIQERGPDFQ